MFKHARAKATRPIPALLNPTMLYNHSRMGQNGSEKVRMGQSGLNRGLHTGLDRGLVGDLILSRELDKGLYRGLDT